MDAPNPDAPYLYVVQTEFGGGSAEAWHEWYDHKHVPELLSVPGFVAADRYQHLTTPNQFLAIYELGNPTAFADERYGQVTGWSEWTNTIREWRRGVYQRLDDPSSWK